MSSRLKKKIDRLIENVIESFVDGFGEAIRKSKSLFEGTSEANMVRDMAYRFLGVQPGDSLELIKSVFRTKSKHLHPDHGGGKGQFEKLKAAYEVVIENEKRRGKR